MAGSKKRKWTDSTSSSTLCDIDYPGTSRKQATSSVPYNASDSIFLSGESVQGFPRPPKDTDEVNSKLLQPELAEQQQNVPKAIFCLDSHPSGDKQATSCAIKLDAPFISCMNSLSGRGTRLQPFPSVPDIAIRVGDARAKRSESKLNPLRSPKFYMMESQLHTVDSAARGSMRLEAYQTYLLTAQREAGKLNISPEDRKLISDLLLQIVEPRRRE